MLSLIFLFPIFMIFLGNIVGAIISFIFFAVFVGTVIWLVLGYSSGLNWGKTILAWPLFLFSERVQDWAKNDRRR
jgi:mannose/fructose/N-acetylgalactosamine-specific phosphotransferase system component IID